MCDHNYKTLINKQQANYFLTKCISLHLFCIIKNNKEISDQKVTLIVHLILLKLHNVLKRYSSILCEIDLGDDTLIRVESKKEIKS